MKKLARLSDGTLLEFPEDTPDDVVRGTVRRVVQEQKHGVDHFGPAIEKQTESLTQAQEVLSEDLQNSIKDIVGSQTKQLSKITTKNVEKKLGGVQKSVEGVAKKVSEISTDNLEKSLAQVAKSVSGLASDHTKKGFAEVAKSMSAVVVEIKTLIKKSDDNTAGIMKAIMANTKAIEEQTKATQELVKVRKMPFTFTRDKDGKVKSARIEK